MIRIIYSRYSEPLSGSEISLIGIGTCRLRDLMTPPNFRGYGYNLSGFTHSLDDSIQKLHLVLGKRALPPYLYPLVFGYEFSKISKIIQEGMGILTDKFLNAEALIIEWSSSKRYTIGDYDINPSYLGSHIVRKGGVDYLDWWRLTSNRGQNNNTIDNSQYSSMVCNRGKIEKEIFDDENLFEILSNLDSHEYNQNDLSRCLVELQKISRGKKLIFLTPYSERVNEIIEESTQTLEEAQVLSLSEIVEEVGFELAFEGGGKNTNHFESERVEQLSEIFFRKLSKILR